MTTVNMKADSHIGRILLHLACLMHDHKCRHLPMLRQGQVVVMVSMRDLMNFELELKTDEIRHMRAYIQESTH